jgi:hypothetical protein
VVGEGAVVHVEESGGGIEEGLKLWVLPRNEFGSNEEGDLSAGGKLGGLKLCDLPCNEFGSNEGGNLSAGGKGLGCSEDGR